MRIDPDCDGPVLAEIYKQYGWSPHSIRYVRGVLYVETSGGAYALKKTPASLRKISFLHQWLQKLMDQGYDHLLPWIKTRSGETYVKMADSVWYALPWFGEEVKPTGSISAYVLIRQLARFHRESHAFVESGSPYQTQVDQKRVDNWKQKKDELKEIKSAISQREFISPFDKVILDHEGFLQKALSFSVQGLDKFRQYQKGIPPRYTLVHTRLAPENVLFEGDDWKWIDFDHAVLDSPVRDIATFMRRFISMEGDQVWDPRALLDIYESEWPLKGQEKKLLALYLAYPESPLQLIHQYYHGKNREEATSLRRLEEEMDRLHLFQNWVRNLWKPGVTRRKGVHGAFINV
ncbi:phosphotransferase [Kroppenstedtia pulmonis]|uniref:Phosphotransferase n=1 Tax=Kroppenstedtia pulmonis TaxID=1380685 RepID=A0A7D3XHZ6_9BACL|nr:phosphotransferase [Kroppenstedtia pulmonis]QKG84084.1 phosphotransferase [Kroppenstedtia pulmonis]